MAAPAAETAPAAVPAAAPSPLPAAPPPSAAASDDAIDFGELTRNEVGRINARRKKYGTPAHEPLADEAQSRYPRVGLALSGGGIRSATFSLGLLQALSRHGCIPRIDYLSTVSGGGYVGSFFGALFIPPQKRGGQPMAPATRKAFLADPLGSPHGVAAVRQLRESGRYLTPGGTSDAFFGAAIVLRNWAAVQFVIGSVAFLLFWFLLLADENKLFEWLVGSATGKFSPTLLALSFGVLVFTLSAAIGYWLTKRDWIQGNRLWRTLANGFFWALLILSVAAIGAGLSTRVELWWLGPVEGSGSRGSLIAGIIGLGAIALYVIAEGWRGAVDGNLKDPSLLVAAEDRVRALLSRLMSNALFLLILIVALLLVDALGSQLADTYRKIVDLQAEKPISSPGIWTAIFETAKSYWAIITAIATPLLTIAGHFALKREGEAGSANVKLSRPTRIMLWGFAVVGLWLALWSAVAHLVGFYLDTFASRTIMTICAVLLVAILSICYSFINLSSLATFYAARLQRAYIGASTPGRPHGSDIDLPGDRVALNTYNAKENVAPLHLINVTIAQTQEANSSIVARDRKGKPMHVSPSGIVYEGDAPGDTDCIRRDRGEEMLVGSWIAVSGAAASSAVGAQTTLGLSILATMTNVRLGYWWNRSSHRREPGAFSLANSVQSYLLNELRGRFVGTKEQRWYLTDGGHFENSAAYALLQREVPYIIISDNGADPDYRFDDLVRLINRAQNDLGVRITLFSERDLNGELEHSPALRACFGTFEQLAQKPVRGTASAPFALLARVNYRVGEGRILIIKPRLSFTEPPEVLAYQGREEGRDFPQQTTGDQFFDEDQWEAYRRLGELAGDRLFEVRAPGQNWSPARDLR